MNYEYCNGYTYTIKKGDTLYEISRDKQVPLALLLRANPFVDVFNLQVGDTICIPSKDRPLPPPRPQGPGMTPPPPRPQGPGRPDSSRTDRPLPPLPPPPHMMMSENSGSKSDTFAEEDDWIRYVVQPGDTMKELVKDSRMLEAFFERNEAENIYLLPGIAYYVPER